MNPLDAFSFGKIIKSFVPGLIATGAPLLLLELGHFHLLDPSAVPIPQGTPLWSFFAQQSLILGHLSRDSVLVVALGAVLIPLALTLGFFLNTLHWYHFNEFCLKRVDGSLEEPYTHARARLEEIARERFCATFRIGEPAEVRIPQVQLTAALLPKLDLQKLNYIWESYFSWYEFDMNAMFALVLTSLAHTVLFLTLAFRWSTTDGLLVGWGVPILWVAATCFILFRAALRNLKRYREQSLWFFVSSLCSEGSIP